MVMLRKEIGDPRPATLADLRQNLRIIGVAKGTGSQQDYEHAKRIMQCWREHLRREGVEGPSYEACVQEIVRWVEV